jgi:hypothetical protein
VVALVKLASVACVALRVRVECGCVVVLVCLCAGVLALVGLVVGLVGYFVQLLSVL